METNKTINRIRFAHWKKSSLAPRAKALGFSRYCKRYKTREDMSLPREQLAKVRTPFKVNEVNGGEWGQILTSDIKNLRCLLMPHMRIFVLSKI